MKMKIRKRKNDLVQFHARTIGYEFYDGEVVEYVCNFEIQEVAQVKKNDIHAVTKVEIDSSISAAHAISALQSIIRDIREDGFPEVNEQMSRKDAAQLLREMQKSV
jgi:hypothetical protein